MTTSPTQLTLKLRRKQGYLCQVVEHWNPFAKIRQDLFGFIDIVAIHPADKHIIGIQCTSCSNHSARRKKIFGLDTAGAWLSSGGLIEIVSWEKKANRWQHRMERIDIRDLPCSC